MVSLSVSVDVVRRGGAVEARDPPTSGTRRFTLSMT
jgi:hypothetical protein